MSRDISAAIRRVGQPPSHARHLYSKLLTAKWRWVLLLFFGLYVSTSLGYALLYRAGGDCIANADAGSFGDSFFFSVQTISTIGFGALYPKTPYSNVVVFVESFNGLILVALATGLMFAKFSRPSAGVVFSEKVIISPRNGVPTLMLRVANARGSDLVEASVHLTALTNQVTKEGERLRLINDLNVVRDRTPVFAMSWQIMHPIDETSPLFGLTVEDYQREDVRLVVNMTAIDGTFSQTVYAYAMYDHQDIVRDVQFVDVIHPQPDGTITLDLTRFHDFK